MTRPEHTGKTSTESPLRIAAVTPRSDHGQIGITFCPGKKDPAGASGAWNRDLATDVQAIRDWGADMVITLLEPHEVVALHVNDLGKTIQASGMRWIHLPIQDGSVPDEAFEAAWETRATAATELLEKGGKLVVHCRGGLGRAGMIAARLLVETGDEPEVAIRRVRAQRPGAIETRAQEGYVKGLAKTAAR